jgi:predicted phage terminase large subunit-like protein
MKNHEYRAVLRKDLYTFIEGSFHALNPNATFHPNWHIEVVADALEKCRSGEIKRLIINVPPRSLKSHSIAVSFVAFLLGHDPSAQVICASYAQELAEKHSLDCRALMTSPFYENTFTTRLSKDKNTAGEFTTRQRGFRLATSVGGTLTGRGAGYLIIDDPHKPDEAVSDARRQTALDWFDNTLRTRLNNQNDGCIIVVMQRLHEDDLVGHITEKGGWTILSFPAIAEEAENFPANTLAGPRVFTRAPGEALHPERESLETLAQLRAQIGEYNFAGQYQQRPSPLGGGMIKSEWFKRYTPSELPTTFDMVFQSWDTANKATELSDFSVCTTWGLRMEELFLLDVYRARLEYPALKKMVHALAHEYRPKSIVIEDKASGTQLLQQLRDEKVHGVTGYESPLDKVMRMYSASNSIESGLVYLPHKADWLPEFLHETSSFPKGRHDDQVDSMSQAIDWIKKGRWAGGRGLFEYYTKLVEKEQGPTRSIFEQY